MHGIDADFFLNQFQRDLTSEFILLHCDSQMKLWHCQCNVPVCLSPSATALPGAALVCALRILFRGSLRELLHCFPADLRFGQISVVLFQQKHSWILVWVCYWAVTGYRSQRSNSNFSSYLLFFSLTNPRFLEANVHILYFCKRLKQCLSLGVSVLLAL